MAKKEIASVSKNDSKKLQTKDLIYAGAFGAIYIVVMLVVVMAMGGFPVLYVVSPFVVGLICATIYEVYVLKVHKFGAALILGILFGVTASSGHIVGMLLCFLAGLLAECVMWLGKYKSRKMFMLSYPVFNLTMVCPFSNMYMNTDKFYDMCKGYYGKDYADKVIEYAVSWFLFVQIGLAILGAAIGLLIGYKLIKKHFMKAGIV